MVGGYTLVDIAHKVVGVGSVGLRAYVALLEGSSADDVVFLQLKQARRSVLARYVHGDSAWHAHQGQRVVEYQQALQTVSDPLLGWTTVGGRQYYVRQFRNMKGTIPLDAIDAAALADYAGIVGHLLAKGHARTSGASMIAGYAGASDKLDRALARFARAYADQTEADHAVLVKARVRQLPVADGALERTGSSFRPCLRIPASSPGAAGPPEHGHPDHGQGARNSTPMPPMASPRVRIRSALVDRSSRSDAPARGGLGLRSTGGAMPVGRLPLHKVVISRITASSPSP